MAKYSLHITFALLFALVSTAKIAAKLQTFEEAEAKFVEALEQEAKFFVSPGTIFPNVTDCWRSILRVEGCAVDLFTSFFTFRFRLSRECCEAAKGIGEKCFANVFSNFPFNPQFPPLLDAFCGTAKAPNHGPSPPAPPPPPPSSS